MSEFQFTPIKRETTVEKRKTREMIENQSEVDNHSDDTKRPLREQLAVLVSHCKQIKNEPNELLTRRESTTVKIKESCSQTEMTLRKAKRTRAAVQTTTVRRIHARSALI